LERVVLRAPKQVDRRCCILVYEMCLFEMSLICIDLDDVIVLLPFSKHVVGLLTSILGHMQPTIVPVVRLIVTWALVSYTY
jgi:hypothetical protein